MPDARPELIFVAGPQKGQRTVLMDNNIIAGRSSQADIKITEETVSRQHLRFALTIDGWIVENLSANKIEISGQSYKRGKQVLLETGDTISLGSETTLLFVSSGDDPIAAMEKYLNTNTNQTQTPPPAAPEQAQQTPPAQKKSVKPESSSLKKSPADKLTTTEKKRKTKLYVSAAIVYLIAMAGLFTFLALAKKSSSTVGNSEKPAILTRETIAAALTCDLNHAPNAEASAKHLRLAREYYRTRNATDKNLYLCVKNYRLYLSFRRPDQKTFQIEDESQYNTAKKELIDKIMSIYENGWALENASHFSQAIGEFELLLQRYLPPSEMPQFNTVTPEANDAMVSENIQDHISYISKFMRKKK
ncbi:MAG TPA: FHA domain-containing protein [Phycisphaerae bacterium]|nr:FHA domain-containing protein [Phycisphaerae bacterium]HPS52370.1 FHA domain-containing protein [Phycisphaerae bacterium]